MISRIRLLSDRARLALREEGFLPLCRKAILFPLCSYTCDNIYESTLDPPEITCGVDGLSIRMITRMDEIEQLESEQSVDEGFDFARDKEIVSKGAVLFCAFVGNELAHITQVFIGTVAHRIYPFSFAMQHTVGLATFTAPKYRRRGIHLWTRSKALEYLKRKKISRAWDVQDKDNIALRDSLVKLGYYLWGYGYRLRLLSLLTLEWTLPKIPGGIVHTHCSISCGTIRFVLAKLAETGRSR